MKKSWVIWMVICLIFIAVKSEAGENWDEVLNLKGTWKFSIGDQRRWAEPGYDDRSWESIAVPSKWEDEGFHGYDGYAWYRKSFDGRGLNDPNWSYSLFLGYIDDVDEVYLNGHLIGYSGAFPPDFNTAYNAYRKYYIPNEFINFNGKNVIAVRVYDAQIEGGIVKGDVGIFVNKRDKDLTVNLRGLWNFALAPRNANISDLSSDKIEWTKIMAPGNWESQGFKNYDGNAWYMKQVYIPKELEGEDIVLILGKIDDFDDVYINGEFVGSSKVGPNYRDHTAYEKLRTYFIPANKFKPGEMNTIVVFVEDIRQEGGIYEGPLGIIKQSQFTRFLRWR